MSSPSQVEPNGLRGRFPWLSSRLLWVAAAVALVVVVVVVLATRGSSGEPGGAATPTTSASSASPSPTSGEDEPSASPSAGADAPSTEAPTDPADPAEPGSEEPVARPTAEPVPIDEAAEPEPQVSVKLAQIEAVEGEANIPGEVGGPSLRVTVSVTNATAADLDLTSAVVNLYYGPDAVPAIDLREPGRRDLPASVAPGGEATGAFVFLVPVDSRGDVTIEFDLSSGSTVLLFAGSVA